MENKKDNNFEFDSFKEFCEDLEFDYEAQLKREEDEFEKMWGLGDYDTKYEEWKRNQEKQKKESK